MKNPRCMIIKDIHGHVNFRISHIHAYLGYTIGLEILSHFVALNRNIYFCFSKISIFCLRFNNLTYRFHNCRGNTNLRGYLFQCHRLFFGNWKWVNSTTEIRVLSSSNLEGKRFGGCEVFSFWLSKQNKKHLSIDVSNWTDFFLNKLFQLSSYLKITIKACLAEVFYSFKMDRHFLRQKVCQRISVMKTNTGVFVIFKSKRGLKMLILWKHRLCFFSLLRTFWRSFFDVIKNFR